jgi:hypothetical protein
MSTSDHNYFPFQCGSCLSWTPEWQPIPGEGPEEVLGTCTAIDPEELPYAWRWALRERTWTRADDPPEGCPCLQYRSGPPKF